MVPKASNCVALGGLKAYKNVWKCVDGPRQSKSFEANGSAQPTGQFRLQTPEDHENAWKCVDGLRLSESFKANGSRVPKPLISVA